ncbi:MAG: exodeoxyribonuclease VII small subunit [Anaerolineales bacterium]|nr:exodeoxyribonuclease VII small subunit [Anaerolineales bacterium]
MAPRQKKTADPEPSYEKAFAELQDIVTKLESGEIPLEEALALYERGQGLAKTCAGLLDKAELRIRELGSPPAETPQDE